MKHAIHSQHAVVPNARFWYWTWVLMAWTCGLLAFSSCSKEDETTEERRELPWLAEGEGSRGTSPVPKSGKPAIRPQQAVPPPSPLAQPGVSKPSSGANLNADHTPPTVPPTTSPSVATGDESLRGLDLFGSLREASAGQPICEPDWPGMALALRSLGTLEGASVDPETGQLVLYGKPADGEGPFYLEDLVVVLRAAFLELESLGMTLDEDPQNKTGPLFMARYFAHCSNTHLGRVMFECDRLMKCLSQGKDNLTQEPLRPQAKDWLTHAEIIQRLREANSGPVWSRFWVNLATGRPKQTQFDGIPLIEPSEDGHTIGFVHHRIFIDTEQMVDPGKGLKLAPVVGKQLQSAGVFADQLTARYDEIAAEFPPFRELQELSKLVVLAEWIRSTAQPLDTELLYCDAPTGTTTPKTTPSMETVVEWEEGASKRVELRTFGGVMLEPKMKMVTAKEKFADPLATTIARHRAELRTGKRVEVTGADGKPRILVTSNRSARGPPEVRAPDYRQEIQGRLQPVRRTTKESPVLGKHEIPVHVDASTGRETMDAPVLRMWEYAYEKRSATFDLGNGRSVGPVTVPTALYITSPSTGSNRINIRFNTTPKFDRASNEIYFASEIPDLARLSPASHVLQLKNGQQFRFGKDNLIAEAKGGGLPHVSFKHEAYSDGPSVLPPAAELARPHNRGPPQITPVRRIEVQSRILAPTARRTEVPAASTQLRVVVRNLTTNNSMEVRESEGRLLQVVKP